MALHWPTFLTRTGSALVFGVVMMAGLLWNDWAFLALVLVIQGLCLREFFRLAEKITGLQFSGWQPVGVQIFSAAFIILLAFSSFKIGFSGGKKDYWPALLFAPALLFISSALSSRNTLSQGVWLLTGILYITIPAAALICMRSFDPVWPVALILMIWMNDTMAYIVGSLIGKTPFSEISPKKTWEGTVGGALLAVAGAAAWAYFSGRYQVTDAVALSLCAGVAGTAGDLLESKLKRTANVKDSGNMMPGHGGALDRFDSLLAAAPFAFAYLYIAMKLFL